MSLGLILWIIVLLLSVGSVIYFYLRDRNTDKITRLAGANATNVDDTSALQNQDTEAAKQAVIKQLPDPVNGQCPDPNFPYLNSELKKCTQCFPNSFNCLTGYQRCFVGMCIRKNSPQCAYYPRGTLGWSVPNKQVPAQAPAKSG